MGEVIFLTPGHHVPDNSDVLICQSNGCNILVLSHDEASELGVILHRP